MLYKHCTKCDLGKELVDFYKNKARDDGFGNYCKICSTQVNRERYKENPAPKNAQSTKWRKANPQKAYNYTRQYQLRHPDRHRNAYLKKQFGITLTDYNNMLKVQKDSCAICFAPKTNFKIALAVDHCHKTGQIRGLLCDFCNRGIGYLKENFDFLSNAANYVKNPKNYGTVKKK